MAPTNECSRIGGQELGPGEYTVKEDGAAKHCGGHS
jgi:hypothetical protein